MSKELITIDTATGVQLYTEGHIESIIKRITEEALNMVPDVETEQGRDNIKSLAYKIARSKTTMDDLGKELNADSKTKIDLVNAERKKMRDEMDELKFKVRQPLTDFEDAEKKRIADIDDRIIDITNLRKDRDEYSEFYNSEYLTGKLAEAKAIVLDDSFGDKLKDAAVEKDITISRLESNIAKRTTEENEKAELDRLRVEKEERDKEDYENRLKKEAAANAKREAEKKADQEKQHAADKARVEQQRIEDEKAEVERKAKEEKEEAAKAIEDAEKKRLADVQAVKDQAEREKQEIVRQQEEKAHFELERIAEETWADDKRKADKENQRTINNNVLSALINLGIDPMVGKTLIEAMAKGQIPHVTVNY